MTLYRVKAGVAYRGYKPGETFEAVLDEAAERRALARGSIEIVRRGTPRVQEGSYRLPRRAADAAKERGADAHQNPAQGRRPDSPGG